MHIIIVGAGCFGTGAAIELKRRGHSVTVIDQEAFPATRGSSTDISKLIRMDYGPDEFYWDFMDLAMKRWESFNDTYAGGETVFHKDGIVSLHYEVPQPGSFEHANMEILKKRGMKFEELNEAQIAERFPQWAGGPFKHAYVNPRAGWAESGRAMNNFCLHAAAIGVEFVVGRVRPVTRPHDGPCKVELEDGRSITGDRLIIACGAWTPLVIDGYEDVMWPTAQIVHHFRVSDPSAYLAPQFLPYIASIERTGFPANESEGGVLKLGHHGQGRRMYSLTPEVLLATQQQMAIDSEPHFRKFLYAHQPSAELAFAPIVKSRLCLYCDSFDGDFWIDADEKCPRIVVAAGGSGHGFKFDSAPIIGEVIADVLESKPNKFRQKFARRTPKRGVKEAARSRISLHPHSNM